MDYYDPIDPIDALEDLVRWLAQHRCRELRESYHRERPRCTLARTKRPGVLRLTCSRRYPSRHQYTILVTGALAETLMHFWPTGRHDGRVGLGVIGVARIAGGPAAARQVEAAARRRVRGFEAEDARALSLKEEADRQLGLEASETWRREYRDVRGLDGAHGLWRTPDGLARDSEEGLEAARTILQAVVVDRKT